MFFKNNMKITKTLELDIPELGRKIKEARKSSRIPLTTICKQIGMSPMNWYRIEKEQQSVPIETLRQIEKVLDVDLEVNFRMPISA